MSYEPEHIKSVLDESRAADIAAYMRASGRVLREAQAAGLATKDAPAALAGPAAVASPVDAADHQFLVKRSQELADAKEMLLRYEGLIQMVTKSWNNPLERARAMYLMGEDVADNAIGFCVRYVAVMLQHERERTDYLARHLDQVIDS